MKIVLTKTQKKYLDKNGPMKASTLERVFEKSVKDQDKIRKQATNIRNNRKTTIKLKPL